MTEKTNLSALWQADLDTLAAQSPNGFVRLLPPRIRVKRGCFSPPWPPSAWGSKPGAWSCGRYVIISDTLLDCPPLCRRYLLSHEYGHLHTLHHLRAVGLLVAAPLIMLLLAILARSIAGPASPLAASVSINLPYVMSIVACFRLLRPANEYQADAFAAQICGRQTVIEGMLWLSRRSGRGMTRSLRKRLEKLGHTA